MFLNKIRIIYKICDTFWCEYDFGNLLPNLITKNNTETAPKNDNL